jgi:plasmid stabilization system protein ParE
MVRYLLSTPADRMVSRTLRYLSAQGGNAHVQYRAELDEVCDMIVKSPHIGSPWILNYRYMKFRKMNYVVYYHYLTPDIILIAAVVHGARRQGFWLKRPRRR